MRKKVSKCTKSVNLTIADEVQEMGYRMANEDRHGNLTTLCEQLIVAEWNKRNLSTS